MARSFAWRALFPNDPPSASERGVLLLLVDADELLVDQDLGIAVQ
jgi:hypothetical protein